MSNNEIICKFLSFKENLSQKYHLLYTIKYLVAPVIYNTKPGSIISFKAGRKNLFNGWKQYKETVCKQLNLSFREVHKTNHSVCVFIYKENALTGFLRESFNQEFLEGYGYLKEMSLEQKINHLASHYSNGCPDEIGVFLGFPIEDVKSYIEHHGEGYKQCRYWKVYHNDLVAENTFKDYDDAKVTVAKEALDRFYFY